MSRTLELGNELAGSCVPDSNERACYDQRANRLPLSEHSGQSIHTCDRQTRPDETRQCRVSIYYLTKEDWGTMATVKPSYARSEWGRYSYPTLKSKNYVHAKHEGSCRCQTCSNPEKTCGGRGWRWCCGFDNGEWKKIGACTAAHNRKTLMFWLENALSVSDSILCCFARGSWCSPPFPCYPERGGKKTLRSLSGLWARVDS